MVYLSAKNNRIHFIGANGKEQYVGLKSLLNPQRSNTLIEHLVSYLQSSRPTSIKSTVNKVANVFDAAWKNSFDIPNDRNPDSWQEFITNTFESWILNNISTASIETKINGWNKIIEPFLQYLKSKGFIPEGVLIAKTEGYTSKKWDTNANKLIGEDDLEEIKEQVENEDEYHGLLVTVDPSQTTDEYLENLMHELKLKLSTLEKSLVLYWQNIKAHYDYGKDLINSVDVDDIEEHIRNDCFYKYTARNQIENVPPIRRHMCKVTDKESFATLLYIANKLEPAYGRTKDKSKKYYPNATLPAQLRESGYDPFPVSLIENDSRIPSRDKINWCLGVLNPRDIAYLIALIIIKCPKFNFEPLLYSKMRDKHGQSLIVSIDGDMEHENSFSVNKHRGKESKVETLDPITQEIFNFIQEKNVKNEQFKNEELGSDFLFLALAQDEKSFTLPSPTRIINWITGYVDKKSKSADLSSFFPSLLSHNLGKGNVSFKAIRATIAVLEWYKTGSIKAAAKKIGNTEKVCFNYYLPPQLTEKLHVLKIRQFQTCVVVATTIDKPEILLKAANFKSIEHFGKFVEKILTEIGDTKTPLVEAIKGHTWENSNKEEKLVSVVDINSLSFLYLFRALVLDNNIEATGLKENIYESGLTSFDLFKFSEYIELILSQHNESNFRTMNKKAQEKALLLKHSFDWKDISSRKGDCDANFN
jgi:hypothetical protein